MKLRTAVNLEPGALRAFRRTHGISARELACLAEIPTHVIYRAEKDAEIQPRYITSLLVAIREIQQEALEFQPLLEDSPESQADYLERIGVA